MQVQCAPPVVNPQVRVIGVMVLEITRGLRSTESSGQQRQAVPVRVLVSLEITWGMELF